MPRSVTTIVPDPNDPTNGVADGVAVTIFKDAGGVPTCRVSYAADPSGSFEFPVSALIAADRVKVRDAALAILGFFRTSRSYT